MLNYLKCEIYRIFTKKSFYLYYFLLIVFSSLVIGKEVIVRGIGGSSLEGALLVFNSLSAFSILFFGINIYLIVYGDDLSNKTLPQVVSTGLSKIELVISKLFVLIVTTVFVYLMMGIYGSFIWYLQVGFLPALSSELFRRMLFSLILTIIYVISFVAISAGVSYIWKKTAIGVTVYFITAFGFAYNLVKLLSMVFNWLKKPSQYMLFPLTEKNVSELFFDGFTGAGYAGSVSINETIWLVVSVYVGFGLLIQYLSLRKKDIM